MKTFIALFLLTLLTGFVAAAAPQAMPTNAPTRIELRDQYDAPQTLAFPTTNIIVLTIADKRGAEEIAGWVSVLKLRYAGRIEIRGLADVGGVPGFLQGKIRKKFQASHTYPVMLDWSGNVCAQFGYEKNVANILILGRDGTILGRSTGPATEQAIQDFDSLLEKHLPPPAKH